MRPKGSPNKSTAKVKEAIGMLIDDKLDDLRLWIEQTAQGMPDHNIKPDPKGAAMLISGLLEFGIPKLARQEHVGEDGGPLVVQITRFGDKDD